MGISVLCDGGCGATAKDVSEFQEFGMIHRKYYCPGCAPSVMQYRKDRDEAHEDIMKQWQESLEKLNKAWKDKHANGLLPDE